MSWMSVAILGGSALSAGGSLLGGILGGQDQVKLGDLPVTGGVNANANPLYSATLLDLLNQLGAPSAGVERQSSPIEVAQQAYLATPGIKNEHVGRLNTVLAALNGEIAGAQDASPETVAGIVNRINSAFPAVNKGAGLQLGSLLTAGGYGSLADLINEQLKWQKQSQAATAQRDALAPTVAKGRQDAAAEIARLQSNFPSYTQADINTISEAERQKARDAVLQQANVGGFNPAAGLAEVERDPNPLARAIALLTGEQGLATNSLAALQTSLLDPTKASTALASLGLNTAINNSSLAAQQANIMAGAQAQTNANNATTKSNSIFGALDSLGNGLSSVALFDLLGKGDKQPGTSSTGNQAGDPLSLLTKVFA